MEIPNSWMESLVTGKLFWDNRCFAIQTKIKMLFNQYYSYVSVEDQRAVYV